MRHAMIMAGGSGTRLWPMSRRDRPKQLLPLIEGRSLLDLAVERARAIVEQNRVWICAGANFRDQVIDTLGLPEDRYLAEPVGRDTLNAIGFSASVIAREDPDATIAVLTADHLISPVDAFASTMRRAFGYADDHPDALVTLAITPTRPATEFGYIERAEAVDESGDPAVYRVSRYIEKPGVATAERLIADGRSGWSSGMFVFRAQAMLDAIARFAPDAVEGLTRIAEAWDTEHRDQTLTEVYPTLPQRAIDYAVMEPASRDASTPVVTIPMTVKWLDVGSWANLAQTIAAREDGDNRSIGHSLCVESRNVFTVSHDDAHLVATLGCEDLIVVHTPDATLICPRDRAADLKKLVERLDDRLR
ncbi:MAG: mannose-1-phosphate guanylyltransferase [Phycisphaerales bacterium]